MGTGGRDRQIVAMGGGGFSMEPDNPHLDDFLLGEADVIDVPGGNTVNALAVWRAQGVDRCLRDAWERGAVLCGLSAGSICWFESGVTDALALEPGLAPFTAGLGFLGGSHCPHYDADPLRRPAYHDMVASGVLPAGYGVDDRRAALRGHRARRRGGVAAGPRGVPSRTRRRRGRRRTRDGAGAALSLSR